MKAENTTDAQFERLIEHIRQERGFDFRRYKHSSLRRRITKRMADVGHSDLETYCAYLEAHPPEYTELLDTILINVTSFFRDPPAWKTLGDVVVPKIASRKNANDPIRVWSAGCATGEEPYSAAILLAEALGEADYRRRVKIYATDIDEDALETARHARFSAKDMEAVPKTLRDKYFAVSGDDYVLPRLLRKSIVFGRHDVVNDTPISNVDLLICRNVLIYLDGQTQSRVLPLLHFALKDSGFLFLGKAETLLIRSPMFSATDLKNRIFAKVPQSPGREEIIASVLGARASRPVGPAEDVDIAERIVDESSLGYMVIDAAGRLALANRMARRLFGLSGEDIGRPFQDLELSYHPVELRSRINEAIKSRTTIRLEEFQMPSSGSNLPHLSLEISSILNGEDQHMATILTFADTSKAHELRTVVQATNEALETANEELQSANEELETTNEELQSTNEELETTNEELETTNEELETTNEELQVRTEEMSNYRYVMEMALGSIGIGVIILDKRSCVAAWNATCEKLWGLREEETVGEHLLSLDFGLDVKTLTRPLKQVLTRKRQSVSLDVPANDRHGRPIDCQVNISPLRADDESISGVILMVREAEVQPAAPSAATRSDEGSSQAKSAGDEARTRRKAPDSPSGKGRKRRR